MDNARGGIILKKTYEMDMCEGALLPKILIFSLPLMLSGILQLLFNAADIVVVGRFSGSQALAAVGSTSSLINLLVNLFIGLSIGTNVLIARYYGAHQDNAVQATVHTSITVALIGGLILIFLGVGLARPLLEMMGTPLDVIDQAVVYMSIYFIGMPAFMVYNYGAAILRAVGDTKRPLYFLIISGVVNVLFNLLFVIVMHLGVAGVALATIIAQYLSACMILYCLNHTDSSYRLDWRHLKLDREQFGQMMRLGIPAGFQGIVFNISNVLIQSSVNSFGSLVMAGNTAASNIEGFVYMAMNAVYQTALSFTSQNYGARQYRRIDQILIRCVILVSIVGLTLGVGAYLLGQPLLGIYSNDPQVIQYGLARLAIISTLYFSCGIMDVFAGTIRGLGYSVTPMIVSLLGACAFRVIWIFTIFQIQHTQFILYISYPISWVLTTSAHLICYLYIRKNRFHQQAI